MEGSQGLCRGWFVHAPFQENIHALGITDARGKKESGLLRNPLNNFLRVYQHKGQWFALRRLEDCQQSIIINEFRLEVTLLFQLLGERLNFS